MNPIVSIICMTYNHECYIADALDSFLMQETTFPFEIIVHDDASTDNTANIVTRYQELFPEIVKPIFQSINKFSKGINITQEYIVPRVTGEYVAMCEGDDFWIDKEKLQKQVDFLKKNNDYIMCFHKVKVVDESKKHLERFLGLKGGDSRQISIREAATGGVVHISSIVMRSEFFCKPNPEWINNSVLSGYDFTIALNAAMNGKVFYMNDLMSAYRSGVKNSLMTKFKVNYSVANDMQYNRNRVDILSAANSFSGYSYDSDIKAVALVSHVIIGILSNDFSTSAVKNYLNFVKQNGFSQFIKLILLKKLPSLSGLLVKLKAKRPT